MGERRAPGEIGYLFFLVFTLQTMNEKVYMPTFPLINIKIIFTK